MIEPGLGQMRGQRFAQQIAPRAKLPAQSAQMGAPSGLGDDFERGRLQQPADVHRLGSSVGEDALACGAARDHGGHAQCRGDALGQ
ncbi:hypothetical protein [Microbacterium sp. NIBRBAC000506063]|uniref:hypothetical protein n=1 Tax=Microbacterium sp. NIBRBAC000506063 TaxID=2734618 RepID=UPI002948B7CE|nr:hypothetical protein [Microbacterium sp. NIBRBAC000506063]